MPQARSSVVGAALLASIAIVAAACVPTSPSSRAPARTAPAVSSAPAASADPAASAIVSASPSPRPAFDPTGLHLRTDVVATGLTNPVDVTSAWDGSARLFIVERPGRIRVLKAGDLLADPFIDIEDRVASGGERGLLGLAFHPDYPADPRLFVDYTDLDGDTVVSEFRAVGPDADRATPTSERILLRIVQPHGNHNGGGLAFGPDGMLYIAMGDGGSGGDPDGNGGRLDTLLAKILRIDVDGGGAGGGSPAYGIPPDNPFLTVPGARAEIWLTGLRNPWRIRFDRASGDLWIGDVGQGAWEEIDVARAAVGGLDFGWNAMEGMHCFQPASGCERTGLTLPVAEYGHDQGCAVVGGVVVRDPGRPRLDGGYLFGDSCSGRLWMLDPVGDGRGQSPPTVVGEAGPSISSINEGEDGTIYATSLGSGQLLRVSVAP